MARSRVRYVEINTEVELSVLELTEDEVESIKKAALKITRICQLAPQDFDRKGVMDIAQGITNLLEVLE